VTPGAPGRKPSLDLPREQAEAQDMATLLRRNIAAMRAQREREQAQASLGEKIAGRITDFTGSLAFVGLHAVLVTLWLAVNRGWIPGVRPFDPTFVFLATIASVEALFLSTFVLISQNRIAAVSDKRADLDLQINLLAEYEVTQLLKLTAAIAETLGLEEVLAPELENLAKQVVPETVLEELDEQRQPEPRRDRPAA
jgi:uncharacterized membrane protein